MRMTRRASRVHRSWKARTERGRWILADGWAYDGGPRWDNPQFSRNLRRIVCSLRARSRQQSVTSILRLSGNHWLGWLVAAIVGVAAQASLYAAPVKTPHVEAELISKNAALVPGQSATVALRLQIENGWHTYWRNPGDSGLPTTLDWKLPPGFRAGAIEWPAPKALPVGPLVNYGYDGTVLHLVNLDVPADLKPGSTVDLAARADWLVCKEDRKSTRLN